MSPDPPKHWLGQWLAESCHFIDAKGPSSGSLLLRVSRCLCRWGVVGHQRQSQFWDLCLSPGLAAAFPSYGWSDTGCRRSWGQRLCLPFASPPTQQLVVHWGFLEHPSSEGPIPGRRLRCLALGRLPARPWTGHLHPLQPLQAPHPLRSGSKASPVPPEVPHHGAHGTGAPWALRSGRGRGWPLHNRSSSESPGTRGVCRPCPPVPSAWRPARARPRAGPLATSTESAECGIRSPSLGRPGRRNHSDSRGSDLRGRPGEQGRVRVGQGPNGRPSAAPGQSAGAEVAEAG